MAPRELTLRYLIIWYAVLLHLVQGALLIANPTAGRVTSTTHIIDWLGTTPQILGIIYICIAVSSILGLLMCNRYSVARLVSLIPQQVFLTLAATAASVAIYESAFGDGVVRSRYFIAADQAPIIIAAFLHSAIIIEGRLNILIAVIRYNRSKSNK